MFLLRTQNICHYRQLYIEILSWIGPIVWFQCVRNSIQIREYFEQLEFEFSRFYYTGYLASNIMVKIQRLGI